MKHSVSGTVRLCLIGLFVESVFSLIWLPQWGTVFGCVPLLWGLMRMRSLHDGFVSAFWLSVSRLLLIGAGAIPTLHMLLRESVWSLLISLSLWLVLACMADGFWAMRISRGLKRNRAAAAVIPLQLLLGLDTVRASLWMLSTVGILFVTALWYYDRAAGELDACDDPPMM